MGEAVYFALHFGFAKCCIQMFANFARNHPRDNSADQVREGVAYDRPFGSEDGNVRV
jgi:hypothetical protein